MIGTENVDRGQLMACLAGPSVSNPRRFEFGRKRSDEAREETGFEGGAEFAINCWLFPQGAHPSVRQCNVGGKGVKRSAKRGRKDVSDCDRGA